MKYDIDKNSNQPAYLQLYQLIREDIVKGNLPYGSKLPSKRITAEETGLSLITVEHAFHILADEGYIETRERSGNYVSYRSDRFFAVNEQPLINEEIRQSVNAEETFPYSVYARTMRRVISEAGEAIMAKSDPAGSLIVRNAISRYLARGRGINVSADQIVLCAGSEYGYGMIINTLGRSRIYGLEDPSYEKIQKIYRANGVRLDFLKLGKHGILTSELERTPASVLHVTPYNSWPSGITANASKRREYIDWAKEKQAVIIEDDYDSEFSSLEKTEDTLFSLEPERSVIYMNTFSRTISRSIRMSYIVIPNELLSEFKEKTGFYSCSVALVEQLTIAELLNSGEFERHINRIRRKRRQK